MLSLLCLAIIHDSQTDHYTSIDFKGEFWKLSFKATGQVEITGWVSLEREEVRSDPWGSLCYLEVGKIRKIQQRRQE